MKKLLMTVALMCFFAVSASAHCPCGCDEGKVPPPKCECQKNCDCQKGAPCKCKKDAPCSCKFKQDCDKKKDICCKKAEFEKRLGLTEDQKAKLDSLHEKQMKKMRKLDAKIRNHEEKIGDLKREKMQVRFEGIAEFEKTLTDEQKAELQKIKQERFDKMKEMMPPKGCPFKCKDGKPCDCQKGAPCDCQKPCPCKDAPQKAPCTKDCTKK